MWEWQQGQEEETREWRKRRERLEKAFLRAEQAAGLKRRRSIAQVRKFDGDLYKHAAARDEVGGGAAWALRRDSDFRNQSLMDAGAEQCLRLLVRRLQPISETFVRLGQPDLVVRNGRKASISS